MKVFILDIDAERYDYETVIKQFAHYCAGDVESFEHYKQMIDLLRVNEAFEIRDSEMMSFSYLRVR